MRYNQKKLDVFLKSNLSGIDKFKKIDFKIDNLDNEDVRNDILSQSNNRLYYPVDPTSRKEALIGGTISCNASGFVPGDKGATRFWVNGLDLLLPNGLKISATRGKYISINSTFIIKSEDGERTKIKIPNYKRPKIKNASGPYTTDINEKN